MISLCRGRVKEITARRRGVSELVVLTERGEEKAINYDSLTGTVAVGEEVIINTTAVDLQLGSGGYHFVLSGSGVNRQADYQGGHIMKLRYTPLQTSVLAVEEPQSPHHETMKGVRDLAGTPVVMGLLHSMLPYAAAGVKAAAPDARVIYMMTDGGALPISFSRLVHQLREQGLLDGTVTAGHAFGGDVEAVNIYTGLLAAVAVLKADIVIVMMGPGITGTDTKFGFSGIEQVGLINAAEKLGGKPIVIPRLSFAERRERHQGISHHTRTVLELAHGRATVVFPYLPGREAELKRLGGSILPQHSVVRETGETAGKVLEEKGIRVTSMGRSFEDDPVLFLAAGAAGRYAGRCLAKD